MKTIYKRLTQARSLLRRKTSVWVALLFAMVAAVFFQTGALVGIERPGGSSSAVGNATATPRITRSGDNVLVAWPATANGFRLQSSSSLTTPDWRDVNITPTPNGGDLTVTLPATAENQFFRLVSSGAKASLVGTSYPAKKTVWPITIDGALNETVWNLNATSEKLVHGSASNNIVTFGAVWDDSYLYVAVRVLDTNLFNDSVNVWEDDSVEVYIDANHARTTTYQADDRQFTKGWNDSALGGIGSQTGVLHGWAAITGGYTIEMAIPWSNLGITPTANLTIGFDIGCNDDDNGSTTRENQLMWAGTASNSSDTSSFGDLVLSPELAGVFQARKTAAAMTINGSLSESVWNPVTGVDKLVVGSAPNNTVTFDALWDNSNLYVAIKVLDGNLFKDSVNLWEDDGAEVYLDPNHARSTTYQADDRQFVKRYNDTGLGGIGSLTGVQHAWAAITGGYTVEMAIPWSNLGITPTANLTIGFDVGCNDDDNGGNTRESQLMWFGTGLNSVNTSGFGDLILSAIVVGDTTPPSVSITAPANNASVSGVVTVTASASDNVGVAGVQFKVDGVNLGAEDTLSPFQVSWDTATVGPGPHTLTAVARDAAGNSATSAAVNVTGGNPNRQFEAEAYSATSGASISGTYVTSLNNGDWIRFNGVNLGSGYITFQARVACPATAANYGQLEVRLGSTNGTQIATLRVLNTGGDTTWETQTAAITGGTGTQDVYIRAVGGNGGNVCNLDWIKLRSDMVSRGATMPFVTYEAENGTYTGTLNGSADSFHKYGAAGRKYVHLDALNEYVQWTASAAANRLTLRYSVPTNTSGTLGVFVNSTLYSVAVASTYCYEWADVNTKPRRYDEVTIPVTVVAGDVVKVQKLSSNTLAWYAIDLIDLEQVPAAATLPAGFFSVANYPRLGGETQDGPRIQRCIDAANTGTNSKKVFIPAGTYTTTQRITNFAGVEVRGAGLWHTTLHNPTPGSQWTAAGFWIGSNAKISDLKITGVATRRSEGVTSVRALSSASGFTIENVHIQNMGDLIGWEPYSNATFRNCRLTGTYFDGIHWGDGPVTGCLVENCFFRGLGDDAIAQVNRADYGLCTGNVAQFNTITATYHGRNIVNIGGDSMTARDNYIDGGYGAGIMIATETLTPSVSRPIQGFKFQRNTVTRSSHTGYNHAGIHVYLSQNPMKDVKIEDCRIENSETRGIRIDNTAYGDSGGRTQFNYNVATGNALTNYNNASTIVVPVLTGNTGF